MVGFENLKFYTDRLVELDTTGKYVIKSNGTVPCGMMRESGETYTQRVPLQYLIGLSHPEGLGILAEGDSMVDMSIEDGDELIIDPYRIAQNGVVVVARYDGLLTVKVFYQDPKTGQIYLVPQNEAKGYPPIVVEDPSKLEICGVVVNVSHHLEKASSTEMRKMVEQYLEENLLNEIIERTAKAGYMTDEGKWKDHVKQEFMAVWAEEVCDRLNIDDKWTWAQERWNVAGLKQALYRLKGTSRYADILDEVRDLVA